MEAKLGPVVLGEACLKFGRDVTRIQCGIAYAVDALKRRAPRPMETVQVGLATTRRAAKEIHGVTSKARTLAGKIYRQAGQLLEDLRTGVSAEKIEGAKKQLVELRNLTMDLYAQGEQHCAASHAG